ncbi:outer membrane beta-barrel protein [Massilia sp. LC238]|uniref:outer membrane beta-barrel protein n=1 Tax=Massilia sp. LC238 TaxID=1502852 RepID=UPI0004E3E278|nr:outer membrane beta-barrel protein [Massilia sp. LC238]KFC67278.1 putative outer membrane protein [Massilia sp. LC238]
MFKNIAVAAALIAASSASFAAQPGSFYAGADIGRTKITDVDGRDTSFGGFVGYSFHPNFAVELGQRRLFERDYRWGSDGANLRADQTSLSLVGSMPIGESFSVYGRLGAARIQERFSTGGFTNKDSTTKALYGIGLSYAISPAIAARVEVQKISQQATNLSTGLSFQF